MFISSSMTTPGGPCSASTSRSASLCTSKPDRPSRTLSGKDPNSRQPDGQGNDRIVICEDTDGDGVADKFTVFADKLSIPTSFCFAHGGVVVMQADRKS